MALKYVVITSVDRDDLRDGGAAHCRLYRRSARADATDHDRGPGAGFRGRMDIALDSARRRRRTCSTTTSETVPRLYRQARPGAITSGH